MSEMRWGLILLCRWKHGSSTNTKLSERQKSVSSILEFPRPAYEKKNQKKQYLVLSYLTNNMLRLIQMIKGGAKHNMILFPTPF